MNPTGIGQNNKIRGGQIESCAITPKEDKTLPSERKPAHIEWIDTAKGLGIILVILEHTHALFRSYIYSFHMPLFFLLSGFLSRSENVKPLDFLKKKCRALLIPYLFFAFISLLLNAFVMNVEAELPVFFQEVLTAPRSGLSINPTLWFLPCLFAIELIFYAVKKVVHHPLLTVLVAVGLSIFGYKRMNSGLTLPFSLYDALYYLVFYVIGNCVNRVNMEGKAIRSINFVCCFLTLILFVTPSMYSFIDQWAAGEIYLRYGYSVVIALIGIAGTIFLSTVLKNVDLLKFWGRNSLIIFATHIFVLNGCYYLLSSLGLMVNQGYHIYSVCSTVLCLAVMKSFINLFNGSFLVCLGKTKKQAKAEIK